jgi:hypothetical protein
MSVAKYVPKHHRADAINAIDACTIIYPNSTIYFHVSEYLDASIFQGESKSDGKGDSPEAPSDKYPCKCT